MKNILIVVGSLIGILVLVVLAYILLHRAPAPQGPSTSVTFPTGTTSSATNGQTGGAAQMTVQTQTGQSLSVKDFINDGVTVEDPSNRGNYYLTGAGPSQFSILYNSQTQVFTVSLNEEPISAGRLAAQSFLQNALGITSQQLCSLRSYITTTSGVNATYAGQSLGMSVCPGSVVLPL